MYTKILVPLDGSELAECVFPYLRWFTTVSAVNEIVLLRVVEPLHMVGAYEKNIIPEEIRHIEGDAVRQAKEYLDGVSAKFRSDKYEVKPVVLAGRPVDTIAEYVGDCDVDLIIMATHGYSGIHRWVSGSIADAIFHAARVPVLMVKPKDKPPDK